MSSSTAPAPRRRRLGSLALALVVATALFVGAVGPVAAQSDGVTDPGVVVDLDETGTAEVTIVSTYDLSAESDREAFETLQNDDEALANAQERFATRMDAVASATAERVGRDVVARDASVSLATVDDGATGVVRFTVTVENLAAVEDDRLVLTEPFASGFSTDDQVVVKAPEGYAVESVTPTPASQDDGTLTYEGDTTMDGFELVLASSDTGTQTPGFGVSAAMVALAGVALLTWRRRD